MSAIHNAASGAADAVVPTAAVNIASAGPSEVVAPSATIHSEFVVPFAVYLKSGAPVTRINLRASPGFLGLFAVHETIDLISWDVTVQVLRNTNTFVAWGFHTPGLNHKDIDTLLAAPYAGYIACGAQGSVIENFSLPPNHSFGRRIKGANLTTPPPVLTFVNSTSTGMVAIVRMSLRVRVAGVCPLPAIVIDENKEKALDSNKFLAELFASTDLRDPDETLVGEA